MSANVTGISLSIRYTSPVPFITFVAYGQSLTQLTHGEINIAPSLGMLFLFVQVQRSLVPYGFIFSLLNNASFYEFGKVFYRSKCIKMILSDTAGLNNMEVVTNYYALYIMTVAFANSMLRHFEYPVWV